MAFVSVGYDGSVNEVQHASIAPTYGSPPFVLEGFTSRTVVGTDRGVGISVGVAAGFGVRDVSDAEVVVQCPPLLSGSPRWDTIVLRRDWAPTADPVAVPPVPGGQSSIAVVQGTTSKVVAPGLQSNQGVLADQALCLAKVSVGSSVVTEFLDLRVFSSPVLTVATLLALPDAPRGTHAQVAGKPFTRGMDNSGNPAWLTYDSGWVAANSPNTNWEYSNSRRWAQEVVTLVIDVKRLGGTITSTNIFLTDGVLPSHLRPSRMIPGSVLNQHTGDTYLLEVTPDGTVTVVGASVTTGQRLRGSVTWPTG